MKSTVRPAIITIAVLLFAGVLYALIWNTNPIAQAQVMPVPQGDQEVVWLNASTNVVAWERFVAGIRRLEQDQAPIPIEVVVDNAFPSQSTATPELAIRPKGATARIWIRWYKLTGDQTNATWIEALAGRHPAPLAIIGGGSSDRARDLARELRDLSKRFAHPPLLLLTTATADQVDLDQGVTNLMSIYPDRTFRFCFTNRQMAEAVADFVWHTEELSPDEEPIYCVSWKDDPYSEDLAERFREAFGPERYGANLARYRQSRDIARMCANMGGSLSTMAGVPPALVKMTMIDAFPSGPFWSWAIPSSVGSYNHPNGWENEAAERLVDELAHHPDQRRPLLILPAMPQPARRLLRGLMRTAPRNARRFVVVTGDAIDFSTIYRDRLLAWPIQDLPFSLVTFAHRNPVDGKSFAPDHEGTSSKPPDVLGKTSTGTQDLLLFRDIVETLMATAYKDNRLVSNADELCKRMQEFKLPDGRPRFDDLGNQQSAAGEYVVYLQPLRSGSRILARSRLQVWHRSADTGRKWEQVRVAGVPTLEIDYNPDAGASP